MTNFWKQGYVLLQLLLLGQIYTIFFEDGFDHHYTYSSVSDIFGVHNVTTVIKFHVRFVNISAEGNSLHLLFVDSFIQHSGKGYYHGCISSDNSCKNIADNPKKWNLDRKFFFIVGSEGIVSMIYLDPEEEHEVLTLKKVLASTLSAKVVVQNTSKWSYKAEESDHAGLLEHEYQGEMTSSGVKLVRTHNSSTDVHRLHNKTLHVDHKGTPYFVEAFDNITLHSNKAAIKRKPIEGETEIKDEVSGDFPSITTVSNSTLTLTSKRLHNDLNSHYLDNMTTDTLMIKHKETPKVAFESIEKDIKIQLKCIHQYDNKFDGNRTECVNRLRQLLMTVHKNDLLKFGEEVLLKSCDNNTVCSDERNLVIDIFAREGSTETQNLILKLVMTHPNVTEEEIRRCLFHCVALKDPIHELVHVVEELCHNGVETKEDVASMTKNGKRACLSLGAMAKSLHDTNTTESERLIKRLEDWLEYHNETKSERIIRPRVRRSVTKYDRTSRKHIETKIVLLHSLGNAGKTSSLPFIQSYMEPNVGISAWRRAAVHSLRHFTCNESATALLRSAIHDDNNVVRQLAFKVYENHPKRTTPSVEHENILLSKNYSYPVAARIRRDLWKTLIDGIRVKIEPPGVDWKKTIGTTNIGASFGLTVRNILDLKLGLLSGHFLVDIHNEAFATAHAGVVNKDFDIFRAFVCYKGQIRYNFNVLKDFGIDSLGDLVNIFDKVLQKTAAPIKGVLEGFNTVIHQKRGGGFQGIINSLKAAVKNIPFLLIDITSKITDLNEEMTSISDTAYATTVKNLVRELRGFIDTVQQDQLNFFHNTADQVYMVLPYVAKKLFESFNLIVEAFKLFTDSPLQSIGNMVRGVTHIKTALAMALEVKSKINDDCMFDKGRTPSWMSAEKEIPKIVKRLHGALPKFVSSSQQLLTADQSKNSISFGLPSKNLQMDRQTGVIKTKLQRIIGKLQQLAIAGPFLDNFKEIMDLIKATKESYTELKRVIESTKAIVQKIFGPKFHPKFPTDRQEAIGGCPEGAWPTTTNGRYKPGVDLKLAYGQSVPMPIDGLVSIQAENKVVIRPTGAEFDGMVIIIENIEPIRDKNEFKAGEAIGKASRMSVCKSNFIHVSIRRKHYENNGYIDPSPFLDRFLPRPKWVQECNDYGIIVMGMTIEVGESVEKAAREIKESVKREISPSMERVQEIVDKFSEDYSPYRPEDSSLYTTKSEHEKLLNKLKKPFQSFANVFKTGLFNESGPHTPDILEILNLNSKPVKWALDQLDPGSTLFNNLNAIVPSLYNCMTETPSGDPMTLTLPSIKRKLASYDMDKVGGGMIETASALLSAAERECPLFQDSVETSYGHLCTAAHDCLEISCSLRLTDGDSNEYLKIKVKMNIDASSLVIDYRGRSFTIPADGHDHFVDLGIQVMGWKTSMVGNVRTDGSLFVISLQAKMCSDALLTCLPTVDIFTDLKFSRSDIHDKKHTFGGNSLKAGDTFTDILKMTMPTFINSLAECGKLTHDAMLIMDNVRETVSKMARKTEFEMLYAGGQKNRQRAIMSAGSCQLVSLLAEQEDNLGPVSKEFRDKVDLCLDGDLPFPPYDVQFFSLRFPFMAGPIPLSIGFGAGGTLGFKLGLGFCFLSMKAKMITNLLKLSVTSWYLGDLLNNIFDNNFFDSMVSHIYPSELQLKVALTPWVGGKVWADLAVDLGIIRGGIQLIGYLLQTKFPVTLELVFSKYPIRVGFRMDLELIPVRLRLTVFVEINLFVTKFKRFVIWEYQCPSIKKNIFKKVIEDDDKTPPEVMPVVSKNRRKRYGQRGCVVEQISGRRYDDTAYRLEMGAQDPVSEVKITYSIGSSRGGNNIRNWTEMGGPSILVTANLPGGIPLYWTVKAKNSQGLEATAQCSLATFDSSLPDGRVEHAYKFSSHPSKLISSVVVFDDSPLVYTHYKAVGYSQGKFGSQFVDWEAMDLYKSNERQGAVGFLRKFSVPREGKLEASILKTKDKVQTPEKCAELCVDYGMICVSFDYEEHSEKCEFHDVVQGTNAHLRIKGTYSNYERLGVGYHTPIEYSNLNLKHGTIYFINANIRNILGYEAFLVGEGTMVDFTPPYPGPVGKTIKDEMKRDGCSAAITQRCLDTTWQDNHRIIIDGPGAATVFNGHIPLYDELYTLTNHYATANWNGFHDDESGIWGYTWAIGRSVCGIDILGYRDPYTHLSEKDFWTDSAFEKGLRLKDGPYYVTVQALNGVELGGSLVTTVCHSTPFIVDTTPPVFSGVTDIIYDEDFDLIAIYYDAKDYQSKIALVEFGLGKTKYDVQLKRYSVHEAMERSDPFVSLKELGLQEGIPAWIRIRVTNNVDIFTTGHGKEPILIDRSPPLAGYVIDGDRLHNDLQFQSDSKRICAQWLNFYDPESGIDRFVWGVGTESFVDNIVKFRNLTKYEKSGCEAAALQHNVSYYSTIFAFNMALNSKSSNGTSDGVLIDMTPPIPGIVMDGKHLDKDQNFTSETANKECNWAGFIDPESGIAEYEVDVYINNEIKSTLKVGNVLTFEDRTISLKHNDIVYYAVRGINGAELSATAESNGMLVDHTSPTLMYISDSENGQRYQSSNTSMHLRWKFEDEESGIIEYRSIIYETKGGIKRKMWPQYSAYNSTKAVSGHLGREALHLENLVLHSGKKYSLYVTAINGALLSSVRETAGVIVDATAPGAPKVYIGLPNEEEDLNENNQIIHDDQNGIRIHWSGRDPESGIQSFYVAVGTFGNLESVSTFVNYGTHTSVYIQNIQFRPSVEFNTTYVVSVYAINGAGLISSIGHSKEIYVPDADIPGVVFDGRSVYHDEMYTFDHTSLAASFFGFESKRCNILGYEWAIGTEFYGSDVLSYTNYGIVMQNKTHGYMQVHIDLMENRHYFVTVRASTGCKQQYILSCSDGITLDTKPPKITFESDFRKNESGSVFSQGIRYQDNVDTLNLVPNISDMQSISFSKWALGTLPYLEDIVNLTDTTFPSTDTNLLISGRSVFITVVAYDNSGNINVSSSVPIACDISAPYLQNLSCTTSISIKESRLTCSWEQAFENESVIDGIYVSLGSGPQLNDILSKEKQDFYLQNFNYDLKEVLQNRFELRSIYVDFTIRNVVGRENEYMRAIVVDHTPPTVGNIHIVTRTNHKQTAVPLKCQFPTSFVEVSLELFEDEETGIDQKRFEVCIGSTAYETDFLQYKSVSLNSEGLLFVDGFNIPTRKIFYVTVRVYNKAGLYTDAVSDAITVSQSPKLTVLDGPNDADRDFQSVLNIIQGHWEYSDPCPIQRAEWKIYDLLGNVLEDYRAIPDAAFRFYDDEISLQNGVKYFVSVKTVDALNRTKIANSNGITVRIQPPYPGNVRDGTVNDLNYQYSTEELSTNWDAFGDSSADPTQVIHHYEVAIGNDRRFSRTRTNVHQFIGVGLNRSFTFKNLNLTARSVRYYITVRSYNMAGAFVEGYSNGIFVGFNEKIIPGNIILDSFQSSVNVLSFSWGAFDSDIGIVQYMVGVSGHKPKGDSYRSTCSNIKNEEDMFDVLSLTPVGLNEIYESRDLTLTHNYSYFASVVAEDTSGMCMMVTGKPIKIDTTPPLTGLIFVNDLQCDSPLFATSREEMHIRWEQFCDLESGIQYVTVTLFECGSCGIENFSTCNKIAGETIYNQTEINLFELELVPKKTYSVNLNVTNGAGLSTTTFCSNILLDTLPPEQGVVKITDDWKTLITFQSQTNTLNGKLALASSEEAFVCANKELIFPSLHASDWVLFGNGFSKDFVSISSEGAHLGIGFNSDLSNIIKSGMKSPPVYLRSGKYICTLRAAKGLNIISTIAVVSDLVVIPFKISNKPSEYIFEESLFFNISDIKMSTNTTIVKTATKKYGVPTLPLNMSTTNNLTSAVNESLIQHKDVGFGAHILGYKIEETTEYYGVFWYRDKFTSTEKWFRLSFDPTDTIHTYTFLVSQQAADDKDVIDLSLIADATEVIWIDGLILSKQLRFAILNWNENGYKPKVENIYQPFYSEVYVSNIYIPNTSPKSCIDGRGFYDRESGIKEIWVGVSNNVTVIDNISKLSLFQKYCFPCTDFCAAMCEVNCTDNWQMEDFKIIDIGVSNLTLTETTVDDECIKNISRAECDSTAYYLTVKVVDFAKQSTYAHSNAIQVDITPPVCEYMKCLDPDYSLDEPTSHLGSSSTIGAYWQCSEDVSLIMNYQLQVTSYDSQNIVMNSTTVDTKTKAVFKLPNNTFEDSQVYVVKMTVLNIAGLFNEYNCSVLVHLFPPDIGSITLRPLYANNNTALDDVKVTAMQNEIGIAWQGGNDDVEVYEWQLGTAIEEEDILSPVKIGINKTGSAAITHGHLALNEKQINVTISEFRGRNVSDLLFEEEKPPTEREKSFFFMEPGRCIFQNFYAVGWSHLRSKLQTQVVCIKRPQDILLEGNDTRTKSLVSTRLGARQWTDIMDDRSEITVDAIITGGGLLLGNLDMNDLTSSYGSAASNSFKPYITNPQLTGKQTSRLLRNRIRQFCNVSFYMAPVPFLLYEDIVINVTIPDTCKSNETLQPALIYWNPKKEQWFQIHEEFISEFSESVNNGIYTASIHSKETKRRHAVKSQSSTGHLREPMAYILAQVTPLFQNSVPKIIPSPFIVSEDTFLETKIDTYDFEEDDLKFEITSQPVHAKCNLSFEGWLTCALEENYYGDDKITIKITEKHLPFNESPLEVEKKIPIHITPVPDKTDRFFLDAEGNIHGEKRPLMVITLHTDANRTTAFNAGTIILADVDGDETFDYENVTQSEVLAGSTYSISDGFLPENVSQLLPDTQYRVMKAYNVNFEFSAQENGKITLNFSAKTRDNSLTPSISINLYILVNPCVYGKCNHTINGFSGCDAIERSQGFDGFFCVCEPGFTDQWCQTNINECLPESCDWMHDCQDLINAYKCTINIPKLLAISISSIIAIVGCIVLRKRLRPMKKYTFGQKSASLEEMQGTNFELLPPNFYKSSSAGYGPTMSSLKFDGERTEQETTNKEFEACTSGYAVQTSENNEQQNNLTRNQEPNASVDVIDKTHGNTSDIIIKIKTATHEELEEILLPDEYESDEAAINHEVDKMKRKDSIIDETDAGRETTIDKVSTEHSLIDRAESMSASKTDNGQNTTNYTRDERQTSAGNLINKNGDQTTDQIFTILNASSEQDDNLLGTAPSEIKEGQTSAIHEMPEDTITTGRDRGKNTSRAVVEVESTLPQNIPSDSFGNDSEYGDQGSAPCLSGKSRQPEMDQRRSYTDDYDHLTNNTHTEPYRVLETLHDG